MFCKCNFYLWYLQNWNHYFDRKLKLQLIKTHKKNFFTKVQKPFQNQTVNAVIFWHQKTNKSKLYLVYLKYLDAIESRKWLVEYCAWLSQGFWTIFQPIFVGFGDKIWPHKAHIMCQDYCLRSQILYAHFTFFICLIYINAEPQIVGS